jgi:putative N6-adenine-specific DNA methylase
MKLVAKTLYGLENILSEELRNLGAEEITPANRAVIFSGNMDLIYKVNYQSRIALTVLMQLSEFRILTVKDLYNSALKVSWNQYMDVKDTFSIVAVVKSPLFDNSMYAGLVVKDAIADYFRKKTGRRPSVDPKEPKILVNLHISNDLVTISLDSSVVPLYKRGYRKEQTEAPLNEVLAAGILKISGWNAKADLLDPMCGSGTIPIEAGMIACNVPPGKARSFFGFQKWKNFDQDQFDKLKEQEDAKISSSPVSISGSDISLPAVKIARSNVIRAGLEGEVKIMPDDFQQVTPRNKNTVIFLNPPYGQRLITEDPEALYGLIGTTLKHRFSGCEAWVISSNREAVKSVGLKPTVKYTLFNGALECTLLKYELYEGSHKASKI